MLIYQYFIIIREVLVFTFLLNQCHNDRYTAYEQNKDYKVRQFVFTKYDERRL